MLRRVEEEAKSVYSEIPAALRVKTTELRAAQRRQANLVEYVADGEGTKAVRAELAKLEPRVEGLEKQLAGLRRASGKMLRAPSLGWLRKRLKKCRSLLELRTAKSAGFLRRLLCPIRLEPVTPTTGRPYYRAHTTLDTLALLDDPESDDGSGSGAKSLRWWTCTQCSRTSFDHLFRAELRDPPVTPVYQKIAAEAAALDAAGARISLMARHFGVDGRTVKKAIAWFHVGCPGS